MEKFNANARKDKKTGVPVSGSVNPRAGVAEPQVSVPVGVTLAGKLGIPPSGSGVDYATKTAQQGAGMAAAVQAVQQRQQQAGRPGVSAQTQETLAGYERGYTPGQGVQDAQAYLDALMGQKPGDYESPYAAQLDALYAQITGRGPFSYDLNGDALYQQYKDQYTRMGRQAMQDTMGQAAGLTGGYGSTYSQNAGQQAYNGYLQQLNDRVPELYDRAYNAWLNEGNELYKQYGMLGDRESQEYGRWRDAMGDWRTDMQTALSRYYNERDFDAGQWQTMLNYWAQKAGQENEDWWKQTQWDYQLGRDRIADERYDTEWQHQLDREKIGDERYAAEWQHQLEREGVSDSQWERQFAAQQAAKAYQQRYSDLLAQYQALAADKQSQQEEQDTQIPDVKVGGKTFTSLNDLADYLNEHAQNWRYDRWQKERQRLLDYGIDIGTYPGFKHPGT